MLTVHGQVHMGAGFTRVTGGGRRREQATASRAPPLQTSMHALLRAVPLLTAGSCGCSAPGRSGRESPTPGNACSHRNGDRFPAHTEILGSPETGSKPNWKREKADGYSTETPARWSTQGQRDPCTRTILAILAFLQCSQCAMLSPLPQGLWSCHSLCQKHHASPSFPRQVVFVLPGSA